jgi:sugar phosphate isomerase/epimerase
MQVAIHSWSFREKYKSQKGFTLFNALDETAAMGFSAIEIMAGKANAGYDDFESIDVAYLDKVTRHARSVGVAITSVAPYNDFAYVTDEKWRLANIEYVKTWLKIAADMQVPNIRVMTGYLVKDEPVEKLERLVIDAFKQCAPVAEACKVNMALENHSSVMANADGLLWLFREVGSKRLTACPDPTNFSFGVFKPDATPADREKVYAETAKYAPFATNSHIKFKGFDKSGAWACIDLPRLLGIYRKAGYNGNISIESIDEPDLLVHLTEARKALEKAISTK